MRYILSLALLMVLLSCCKKTEEDWRMPYTGVFDFMCAHSEIVLTGEGWEERLIDTSSLRSMVETYGNNRMKIKFGEGVIGVNFDHNILDTVKMIVTPILAGNGVLNFPWEEYPSGGLNKFEGNYSGMDTIYIYIQYGYGLGGYEKYKVLGIRKE